MQYNRGCYHRAEKNDATEKRANENRRKRTCDGAGGREGKGKMFPSSSSGKMHLCKSVKKDTLIDVVPYPG